MKNKLILFLILLIIMTFSIGFAAADTSVATTCWTEYKENWQSSWTVGPCDTDDFWSYYSGGDAADLCRVSCSYTTIEDVNLSIYYNKSEVLDLLSTQETDIFDEIEANYYNKDDIDSIVEDLELAIIMHNHGTINLQHFDNESPWHPDTLRVWGEAPLGAEKFRVYVRLADKSIYLTSDLLDVETNQQNENTYNYFVDLTDFDPYKYNILVKYYDSNEDWMAGYDNGGLFDDLYILWLGQWLEEHETWLENVDLELEDLTEEIELIHDDLDLIWDEIEELHAVDEDLQNQIDDLVQRVENLEESLADLWLRFSQIGDFGLEHTSTLDEQLLYIDGSGAPQDANYAKITVKTIDGNRVASKTVEVNSDGTFEHEFNVEGWAVEGMNIYVSFYKNQRCHRCSPRGYIDTIYEVWYGMLPELNYGFEHIDEKLLTVYYMNEPIEREISYSIMPKTDGLGEWFFSGGLYEIRLVMDYSNNGEEISQVIEGCTWLDADRRNYLTSMVELPEPGLYAVRLEAQRKPLCSFYFDEEFWSNYFPIHLRDLKDDLPEAELTIISPEPNPEDVYWTNSESEFTLAGAVYLNGLDFDTQENPYCDIIDLTNNKRLNQLLPVNEEEEIVVCSDVLTMAQLHASNGELDTEGIYTFQLELDSIGIDPTDTFEIGLDNTLPTVNEIFPAEEDAVSGTVTFTTNVTDDRSGVETVWITLTIKNGSVQWTQEASYNETTQLWEVIVDTTEVPDGLYDITVDVWDYAGNFNTLTIDPIIDNTAPVVEELLVEGFFGTEMSVQARLTDNLAGISNAQALFLGYECDAWESESCTLDWCEYVDKESYLECSEFTWTNDECITQAQAWCEENWETNQEVPYLSYDDCVTDQTNECSKYTGNSCEDFCDIIGEDTGYESYDACIAGCTDEHCTWVEFGSWEFCDEDEEYLDEDCYSNMEYECSQFWNEMEYASYEDCMENYDEEDCMETKEGIESCIENNEEECSNWPDAKGDYASYEDCMNDQCYSEYCDWTWDYECNDDSSACYAGESGQDDDCLESVEELCLMWNETEYESYDDCFESESEECYWTEEGAKDCVGIAEDECSEASEAKYQDCFDEVLTTCYSNSCEEFDETYDDPTNFNLNCEDNCFANFDCAEEDRFYDEVPTDVISLNLTSGDIWDGIWTGTTTNLNKDKHYKVFVGATDIAGNENTESNKDESGLNFFSMLGYTVTLNVPAESSSILFDATGTVTSSDGTTVDYGTLTTIPGNDETTPILGAYTNEINTESSGTKTITAEFRPYDTCNDIIYTATEETKVTIRSGSSGGSNGGGRITKCSNGIDDDKDGLVDMKDPGCSSKNDDDEYNAPETPKSSVRGGGFEVPPEFTDDQVPNLGGNDEKEEGNDNKGDQGLEGITAAVVGGDSNTPWWAWPALIVVLAGLVTLVAKLSKRKQ